MAELEKMLASTGNSHVVIKHAAHPDPFSDCIPSALNEEQGEDRDNEEEGGRAVQEEGAGKEEETKGGG